MQDVRALAAATRESVSARQMGERMGLKPDKKGFAICPFHAEKTGSMRLYDGNRGYHCFGCGANGSVIDLVMKYYNLSLMQAICRIDADFGLCLTLQGDASPGEMEKARKARESAIQEKERREKAHREALEALWAAMDEVTRLESIIEEKRPQGPHEPWNDEYIQALRKITEAREDAEHLAIIERGMANGKYAT